MGIQGTGASLPAKVLTNDEIATFVDTSDEWISQRSGIRERHIIGPDEGSLSLALAASQEALANAGITASELDLIIVGSETSDRLLPAVAARLHAALGVDHPNLAFDIRAACSGFLFGLINAEALMERLNFKTALVVGVDTVSPYLDWRDRNSCVLFGDGAGAAVITRNPKTNPWILGSFLQTDGRAADLIRIDASSRPPSTLPPTILPHSEEAYDPYLKIEGREVFKFAVPAMSDAITHVLEATGVEASAIDLFVPHQANSRIIEAVGERIGITEPARIALNLERVGNTSSASIPMALHEAVEAGRLFPGARVLLASAGAGMTYGAALLVW